MHATLAESIDYSVEGQVATITLNRPQRKNAFTLAMLETWANALDAAEHDPDVRVVILTGAGDAFCSGVDLSVLSSVAPDPLARRRLLADQVHAVAKASQRLTKPLVAAVNGVAVGAGLDMALLCDMRFAARTARMSEGYIRAGLVPGDGGAWLLPRLVGPAVAIELLMTGDFINAEEALRIGMVNRVYDDDQLMPAVHAFARQLCERAPLPLSIIKRAVGQAYSTDLPTALDTMASHMAVVQSTEDFAAAQRALSTGETPQFTGH
jgi:enoyl-CoA hydratase/carnithine racemase